MQTENRILQINLFSFSIIVKHTTITSPAQPESSGPIKSRFPCGTNDYPTDAQRRRLWVSYMQLVPYADTTFTNEKGEQVTITDREIAFLKYVCNGVQEWFTKGQNKEDGACLFGKSYLVLWIGKWIELTNTVERAIANGRLEKREYLFEDYGITRAAVFVLIQRAAQVLTENDVDKILATPTTGKEEDEYYRDDSLYEQYESDDNPTDKIDEVDEEGVQIKLMDHIHKLERISDLTLGELNDFLSKNKRHVDRVKNPLYRFLVRLRTRVEIGDVIFMKNNPSLIVDAEEEAARDNFMQDDEDMKFEEENERYMNVGLEEPAYMDEVFQYWNAKRNYKEEKDRQVKQLREDAVSDKNFYDKIISSIQMKEREIEITTNVEILERLEQEAETLKEKIENVYHVPAHIASERVVEYIDTRNFARDIIMTTHNKEVYNDPTPRPLAPQYEVNMIRRKTVAWDKELEMYVEEDDEIGREIDALFASLS